MNEENTQIISDDLNENLPKKDNKKSMNSKRGAAAAAAAVGGAAVGGTAAYAANMQNNEDVAADDNDSKDSHGHHHHHHHDHGHHGPTIFADNVIIDGDLADDINDLADMDIDEIYDSNEELLAVNIEDQLPDDFEIQELDVNMESDADVQLDETNEPMLAVSMESDDLIADNGDYVQADDYVSTDDQMSEADHLVMVDHTPDYDVASYDDVTPDMGADVDAGAGMDF